MIGGVQVPTAPAYKVVVKDGWVWHYYPDGRKVKVRQSNAAQAQQAGPGTANVPARPAPAAPVAAAAGPGAPSSSALQDAAAAAGIPISTLASGYYDPALLAAQRNAVTGNQDLHADTGTQLSRLTAQYGIDQAGINRGADRNIADLQQALARGDQDYGVATGQNAEDLARTQQRTGADYTRESGRSAEDYGIASGRNTEDYQGATGRENQDFSTQGARLGEDHTSDLASLQRAYDRLKGQQQEGINNAGVLKGGAILQAAAKRAANQAFDQKPIDTAFQRNTQDLNTGHGRTLEDLSKGYTRGQSDLTRGEQRTQADLGTNRDRTLEDALTSSQRQQLGLDTGHTRLGQDTSLQVGRQGEDRTAALGQLGVNLGNQSDDLTTALGRSDRDTAQFGLDTGGEIAFQATQNGYVPPALAAAAAAAPAPAAPAAGGGGGGAPAAPAQQGNMLGQGSIPPAIQQAMRNPQPAAGYQFVQDSGSRAGMSYNVVLKNGKKYRKYSNGDVVLVS